MIRFTVVSFLSGSSWEWRGHSLEMSGRKGGGGRPEWLLSWGLWLPPPTGRGCCYPSARLNPAQCCLGTARAVTRQLTLLKGKLALAHRHHWAAPQIWGGGSSLTSSNLSLRGGWVSWPWSAWSTSHKVCVGTREGVLYHPTELDLSCFISVYFKVWCQPVFNQTRSHWPALDWSVSCQTKLNCFIILLHIILMSIAAFFLACFNWKIKPFHHWNIIEPWKILLNVGTKQKRSRVGK